MTTYADPTRCPDCHSLLGEAPSVCRRCALPLTGPTAIELFTTLQRADGLLATLRRQAAPVAEPALVSAGSPPAAAAASPAAGHAPRRATDLDAPRLSGASVPKILLTL